ncbi:MAG TPA: hypothetical protein VIW92_02055 [Thermoanaerobaculia bacterium]
MRNRIKLLSLTVGATVVLLAAGAFLVVLGIFDEYLGWDLFSPEAEKLLFGLFFACLSLGGFGAAISGVLGVQEVVKALRRMIEAANPSAAEPVREAPRRRYAAVLAAALVLLVAAVGILNAANRKVETERLATFKTIVSDQMLQLGPHLTAEVSQIPRPCPECGTRTLAELHRTLEELSFCQSGQLFMADPENEMVLWRFPEPSGTEGQPPGFARFFIASDIDRAVKQALTGDTAWIDQMNGAPAFNWYEVIKDPSGKVRAVLKIYGDPTESYRDYQAVAQAAEARKGS